MKPFVSAALLSLALVLTQSREAVACAGGDDNPAWVEATFDSITGVDASTPLLPAGQEEESAECQRVREAREAAGDKPVDETPQFRRDSRLCFNGLARQMNDEWGAWLNDAALTDAVVELLIDAPVEAANALLSILDGRRPSYAEPRPAPWRQLLQRADSSRRAELIRGLRLAATVSGAAPLCHIYGGNYWREDESAIDKAGRLSRLRQLRTIVEPWVLQESDRFLRQRAAHLALRLRFYSEDWRAVVSDHERLRDALEGPSPIVADWAAQYRAGALLRSGQRTEGLLEAARLGMVDSFKPRNEREWRAVLAAARKAEDKAAVWVMISRKFDAETALRELLKLDASHEALGAVAERAMAAIEATQKASWPDKPPIKTIQRFEKLALEAARHPAVREPWLMWMLAAHASALRGDLATTRDRLTRSQDGRPEHPRIEAQAATTLAMGLVHVAATKAEARDELGAILLRRPAAEDQWGGLQQNVAKVLVRQRKDMGGALLRDDARWDLRRTREMHGFVMRASNPLDEWIIRREPLSRTLVTEDLAWALLAARQYDEAVKLLADASVGNTRVGAEPFRLSIQECFSCDEERFKDAPPTLRSIATEAQELARRAVFGDDAAQLQLATFHYNISLGTSRRILGPRVERPADGGADLAALLNSGSRDPEIRARAAWLMARTEQHRLPMREWDEPVVPVRAYDRLLKDARTSFAQEALRECSYLASYVRKKRR